MSACLLGVNCRWDGENRYNSALNADTWEWLAVQRVSTRKIDGDEMVICVPVCPEQLGGLTTPREPAEIQGGDGDDVLAGRARAITKSGLVVADNFIRGAQEVLKIARLCGADAFIGKWRSPSCSTNFGVPDGSFSDKLRPGLGVCAALLKQNHIKLNVLYGGGEHRL